MSASTMVSLIDSTLSSLLDSITCTATCLWTPHPSLLYAHFPPLVPPVTDNANSL